METVKRKIIKIDEDLCDGCGECVPACAEGAIQVVDGKAKLVSEVYCDGLGDCLGECPQGAITLEEREAVPFNEKAVEEHLRNLQSTGEVKTEEKTTPCTASRTMEPDAIPDKSDNGEEAAEVPSQLQNWPIQLKLVPPDAPFREGANLIIAADCVPFALSGFHRRLLRGKSLLIGCPKLDGADEYVDKLAAIFKQVKPEKVTVAIMEVPCCRGLLQIVEKAREEAGVAFETEQAVVTIRGEIKN